MFYFTIFLPKKYVYNQNILLIDFEALNMENFFPSVNHNYPQKYFSKQICYFDFTNEYFNDEFYDVNE